MQSDTKASLKRLGWTAVIGLVAVCVADDQVLATAFEAARITKEGRRIHVSYTSTPIRDAAGQMPGRRRAAGTADHQHHEPGRAAQAPRGAHRHARRPHPH